jgi:succinate dehydrogenase / fumarate reductase membrane anchor subunit
MAYRTPLGRVRALGSAQEGTNHFIALRVTSVALAILLTLFLVLVVALVGEPYETVRQTLASPLAAVVMAAGVAATIVHMRLGMQVVIEDYVHEDLSKLVLLTANALFSWGVGLVCLFAILKLALGS